MASLTISQDGGTLYFRQTTTSSELQYSSNNTEWTDISSNQYPLNIQNTDPSTNNVLTVQFTTDITFTQDVQYFICGSQYITFNGLKNDEERATITFNGVEDCLGLIQNGTSGANGNANITVENIHVASLGNTTLAINAGWVCQSYFGKGVSDVSIDNCSSSGDISGQGAGGICGSNAKNVEVSNCYSSGNIGESAGGICGGFTGANSGTVNISKSYSSGNIGESAGGICGASAGANSGTVNISNSYSSGNIGESAGGICGAGAGANSGIVNISKSYSSGNIGENGGGICGASAGADSGTVNITNVYSLYANGTGGMVGISGTAAFRNSYGANGSWSSTIANENLLGTPDETNNLGTTWGYYIIDTPYYLIENPEPQPINPVCFPAGTPILTDQGIIHIDKINTNIHTIRNSPIVAITKTITPEKYLICFNKNALGKNVPFQKTIISQNHRIWYKGKMVKSKQFLNKFNGVEKVKYTGEIMYNVLLEKHDKMVVNNLICETMNPKNEISKLYRLLNTSQINERSQIINDYNRSKKNLKNNSTTYKFKPSIRVHHLSKMEYSHI